MTETPSSIAAAGPPNCSNCGTALAGRYCAACGQDSHFDLTLGHFVEETVEGLTHFESSFWRTVWLLLFKPGELTRQYLAGRRRHYMPPVRSYLVISLLYFLLTSLPGATAIKVVTPSQDHVSGLTTQDCASMPKEPAWLARVQQICEDTALDHGRALDRSIAHLMPRVMFCVLPLVALVQFWLTRRQRRYYVESLIFVTHFQSFHFLVGAAVLLLSAAARWLLSAAGDGIASDLDALLYLWMAIYLYLANRRCYGAGAAKALVSVAGLALAYLLFTSLGAVLATVYAAVVG